MSSRGPGRAGCAGRLPLLLYFGTVRRPEFYADLVGADVGLGLLLDADRPDEPVPDDLLVVERVPFSAGVDAVAQAITRLAEVYDLESVINIEETLVTFWAQVCERLGLPAVSRYAATAARDKDVMRSAIATAVGTGRSAASGVAGSEEEALRLAAATGSPVILKPANLWSSHFVSQCPDPASLARAFGETRRAIAAYLTAEGLHDLEPRLLVEEQLVGSLHSIDCVALGQEVWTTPIVDLVTGAEVGRPDYIDFAGSTTTRLTADEQREMLDLVVAAVRALGITPGVAHVECIQTADGPRFLEAAARPGSHKTFMLREAYDINLLQGYRDVLRGKAPDLAPRAARSAAWVTPFPLLDGRLLTLDGLPQLYDLPSFRRVLHYRKLGERVTSRQHGGGYVMTVELVHDDADQLQADYRAAQSTCREILVVEPDPVPPAA